MSLDKNELAKADVNTKTEVSINKSRRSFAKVGVISPVLFSFVSKTVWGQSIDQCSISGNLSGNTSPGHQYQDNCDTTNPFGVSPGYWLNPNGLNIWPVDQSTKFNSIFGCKPIIIKIKSGNKWSTSDADPSLYIAMQVAQNGKIDGVVGDFKIFPKAIAHVDVFHAVAAYLNASMATFAFPFSQSDVVTSFCSGSMALIKEFQSDPIIHGGSDVVKQWLIDNGLYLN